MLVPMGVSYTEWEVWEVSWWVSDSVFHVGGRPVCRNFRARPNAETDNSLIPRPSGRFPSFGSVLDETLAARCAVSYRGVKEWWNSGKLTDRCNRIAPRASGWVTWWVTWWVTRMSGWELARQKERALRYERVRFEGWVMRNSINSSNQLKVTLLFTTTCRICFFVLK